jgi:hypothetical protein
MLLPIVAMTPIGSDALLASIAHGRISHQRAIEMKRCYSSYLTVLATWSSSSSTRSSTVVVWQLAMTSSEPTTSHSFSLHPYGNGCALIPNDFKHAPNRRYTARRRSAGTARLAIRPSICSPSRRRFGTDLDKRRSYPDRRIQSLRKRGYKLSVDQSSARQVRIGSGNEFLTIQLEEHTRQVRRQLSDEDRSSTATRAHKNGRRKSAERRVGAQITGTIGHGMRDTREGKLNDVCRRL